MNVAFYDVQRKYLIHQEILDFSLDEIRSLALQLTANYSRKSTPSYCWVAWMDDPEDYIGVFLLDQAKPAFSEITLNRIENLIKEKMVTKLH